MMSNTDLFYETMKRFQDKRTKITEEYERDLGAVDKFRGSKGYKERLKELQDDYEAALIQIRCEAKTSLRVIIGSMMDAVGSRPMTAPTNEQVNLLNVLKMKRNVTLEQCQRTAEAVKDNPIAVGVVTEIAREHGIMSNFDGLCSEMSSKQAFDIVEGMRRTAEDFLSFDTSRASRLALKFRQDHYGVSDVALTKRRPFTDKSGCFLELVGLDEAGLRKFSDIVDT